MLAGWEESERPLAGKSTLNRLELGAGSRDRYKKMTFWRAALDELLVQVFLEAHRQAPAQTTRASFGAGKQRLTSALSRSPIP